MSLVNLIRQQVELASSQWARTRMGIIKSYDPSHYAVKVQIQPEGTETGWLPVATPWVGNGWGMFAAPSPGDVVDVHFQEGGKEAGFVSLRFFSTVTQPLAVPSAEFWLVHKSGSLIKLTNDGKLTINGNVEIDGTAPTINITASTVVNVTAPAINLGSNGETLHKLVNDQLVALYNGHTHQGVQSGGSNSGVPNQLMGGSHTTTVVSAG